jgi:hypothetical protein
MNLSLLEKMLKYKYVCYAYVKATGAYVGLRVKMLNEQGLKERLEYIYINRLKLSKIKTDKEMYT